MPNAVKADLKWWCRLIDNFNGSSKMIKDNYCYPMVSDSPLRRFAVYLGSDWAAGTWSDDHCVRLRSDCNHVVLRPVTEFFDPLNINILELWPIMVGLKRWSKILTEKAIWVFTDNTQVMYMLLNGIKFDLYELDKRNPLDLFYI